MKKCCEYSMSGFDIHRDPDGEWEGINGYDEEDDPEYHDCPEGYVWDEYDGCIEEVEYDENGDEIY